jgi:TolA-binding protein
MLSSYAEVLTMNFNRKLVTGLFGLALIAAPITAAAKDNDSGRNNSHQEQAQSRSNESHADARQQEQGRDQHQARVENRQDNRAAARDNRQDNRNQVREERQDNRSQVREERQDNRNQAREQRNDYRGYTGAPDVNEHRDAREDRREGDWNRDRHEGGDRDGHWIYGDRGRDYDRAYDPDYDNEYASGWVMPRGYGGGACAWARHLRNVYNHDRYTGHPAAAESLLWQMRRAERSCGVPYGYNSYRYRY